LFKPAQEEEGALAVCLQADAAHCCAAPPLDHAPLRPRCCPAPSPGRHCWYLCLSDAMRGVRCVLYGTPCGKGGGRTDRCQSNASTRVVVGVPCLRPSCARHRHKNANTSKPDTKSHLRGAGRGAARLLGSGTLCLSAPFAEPRPPAESSQTAPSSQHCLMHHHL